MWGIYYRSAILTHNILPNLSINTEADMPVVSPKSKSFQTRSMISYCKWQSSNKKPRFSVLNLVSFLLNSATDDSKRLIFYSEAFTGLSSPFLGSPFWATPRPGTQPLWSVPAYTFNTYLMLLCLIVFLSVRILSYNLDCIPYWSMKSHTLSRHSINIYWLAD